MKRRRRPDGVRDGVRYAPRAEAPAGPAAPPPDVPNMPADAAPALPPAAADALRALYAAPAPDAPYWDALAERIEARLAQDRAAAPDVAPAPPRARAVPVRAASPHWAQALARWTRPALAAAGVALAAAGAVFLRADADARARSADGRSAYGVLLGDPYDPAAAPLPSHDPVLARVVDALDDADPSDTARTAEARARRVAAELLSGGLVRRAPGATAAVNRSPVDAGEAERRLRREATFRAVLPAPRDRP